LRRPLKTSSLTWSRLMACEIAMRASRWLKNSASSSFLVVRLSGASSRPVDEMSQPVAVRVTVTFSVPATVSTGAPGSIANTAIATLPSGVTDPAPANNSATDVNQAVPPQRMTLEVRAGEPTVVGPTAFEVPYSIDVKNTGSNPLTNLQVSDSLTSAFAQGAANQAQLRLVVVDQTGAGIPAATVTLKPAAGEPIPYIKGYAEFRGIELLTKPGVFVPRDSSEFLAEQAIRRLRRRKHPVHVDLATGGGTIALAVADEVPKAEVWGTDVAGDAVRLARKNARTLELAARFEVGDLFDGLPKRLRGSVDVITLHPPYVPAGEIDDLPDEIRDWEPPHTLTDQSTDGLGLIGRTVGESPRWLRTSGWLLMEVSPDRVKEVKRVYTAGGFRDVQSTKGGELKVTRVIVGRRPR